MTRPQAIRLAHELRNHIQECYCDYSVSQSIALALIAKMEAEDTMLTARESEPDLPELIGSPDQIKWATDIRARAMKSHVLSPDLLKNNRARVWIARKDEWK